MAYTLDDWFDYFFVKGKPNKRISVFNTGRFKHLHKSGPAPDELFLSFLRRRGIAVQTEPVYTIEVLEKGRGFKRQVMVRVTSPLEGVIYTNEYFLEEGWNNARVKDLRYSGPADVQIVENLAKHLRRFRSTMFGDAQFGIVRFKHLRAGGEGFHFLDNPLFVTWLAAAGIIAIRGDFSDVPSNEFRNWPKVYKGPFWSEFEASKFFQSTRKNAPKIPSSHNVTRDFTVKMAHVDWAILTKKDFDLVVRIYHGKSDACAGLFVGFDHGDIEPEHLGGFCMNIASATNMQLIETLHEQGFSDRFVSFVHRLKVSNFGFVRFTPDGCSPAGWPTVDDDTHNE